MYHQLSLLGPSANPDDVEGHENGSKVTEEHGHHVASLIVTHIKDCEHGSEDGEEHVQHSEPLIIPQAVDANDIEDHEHGIRMVRNMVITLCCFSIYQ